MTSPDKNLERAEKIITEGELSWQPLSHGFKEWITLAIAQALREAQEEAVREDRQRMHREPTIERIDSAWKEGFTTARDRAAEIIDQSESTPNPIDLAERIRKMKL